MKALKIIMILATEVVKPKQFQENNVCLGRMIKLHKQMSKVQDQGQRGIIFVETQMEVKKQFGAGLVIL